MDYDVLIAGAGLYGCVYAHEAAAMGKRVLVIDKRDHIAGNCYTKEVRGIHVHRYGAHIFHTSDREVWEYVQRFARFNHYINSPVAIYRDELYNLPFNMNTFYRMWGTKTPAEAKAVIDEQRAEAAAQLQAASGEGLARNLEEQGLLLAGRDIFDRLIRGYTEKQWGRPCAELPAFIINRLPFRFTYDNNYFNDRYQGIPIGGYTAIIEKMLEGSTVRLSEDFFAARDEYAKMAKKIIFTGMIDEYYDHCYGPLEYRSLRFENKILDTENFQGNAVVNYTEYEVPYTRIIEHKHFEFMTGGKTVITYEYPSTWKKGDEPYYPLNDERNNELYGRYKMLADKEENVIFGGRLGQYRYYDMHQVVDAALTAAEAELKA